MNEFPNDLDFDGEAEVCEFFRRTQATGRSVNVAELLSASRSAPVSPHGRLTGAYSRSSSLSRTRDMLLAIGALALILLAGFWGLTAWRPALAFEQVRERVAQTQTVRFITTNVDWVDGVEFDEGAHLLQNVEQEIESMRAGLAKLPEEEREAEAKKLEQFEQMANQLSQRLRAHGNRPWETRTMIQGRYLKRDEQSTPHGDFVQLYNAQTGESVSIDHERRLFDRHTQQVIINMKTGERTEHNLRGSNAADFYAGFRNVPQNAKRLNETKSVNGKDLIGFQTVEEVRGDTWTRTYWIDPDSLLPREIETQYRSSRPKVTSSDWRQFDIEFDVKLDDSLFDMTPPPGYEVRESSIMGLVPDEEQ